MIRLISAVIICLLCLIPLSQEVLAQQTLHVTEQDLPQTQQIYQLGVILVNVGEIDLSTGAADLSFWVTLDTDDVNLLENGPPNIDFINGEDLTILHENIIGTDHYEFKVNGIFYNANEFRDWPLSSINLSILIETDAKPIEEIKFVVNTNGSYADDPYIPGWTLDGTHFETEDHFYDEDLGTYSRYVGTFVLGKPLTSSFLQGLFPVFIIGIIAVFNFYLNPLAHETKMNLAVALLLALIFIHIFAVSTMLPPLEYLTLNDKILTVVYVMIIFSTLEILIQRKFNERDDYKKAHDINKKMRYLLPIVIAGTFLILLPF